MAGATEHPQQAPSHPAPIFLAGPTATGKSEVALLLAERLGGEIISVDSMQVYRGLDIGTAKPSPGQRDRVPHHLIDVANLTDSFDVARFVDLARKAVADVQARGRVPILCGGTGLYFKAFLEGLGEAPPADARLRQELEGVPLAEVLRELEERDPATFEKIDRQNHRRVVRAVEVIRLTGRPFSDQRAAWCRQPSTLHPNPSTVFGLARRPDELRTRIDTRVDEMFARGLVAETRHLLEQGLAQNRTAMQAIGYRQVVEHLRGERAVAESITLVKQRTRQFAKRQMTWFRHQLSMEWIEVASHPTAAQVADRVESVLRDAGKIA